MKNSKLMSVIKHISVVTIGNILALCLIIAPKLTVNATSEGFAVGVDYSNGTLTLSGAIERLNASHLNALVPDYFEKNTVTSIVINQDTILPSDSSKLFEGFSSVTTINLSGVICTTDDTKMITNMKGMFDGCTSLTTVTFPSGWNDITSEVTNMETMFVNCSSLSTINNIDKFNTENVTSMASMFDGCCALETLDLSSFNTANVADMTYMFNDCTALMTIVVGDDWTVSTETYCGYMFHGDSSLVGGLGTICDPSLNNYHEFADIDGRSGDPGYLTYKEKITTLYGQLFTDGQEFTFKIGFDTTPETSYLILVDGDTVIGQATAQGDKIFFTYKSAARYMIDTKTVKILKQGGIPLIQKDVSMADYLRQLYNDTSSSEKVKNMAGTILRYSAASQKFSEYKEDTLVNKGIGTYENLDFTQPFDGYTSDNTAIDASVVTAALSSYGLTYYGINVSTDEDISLMMAFKLPTEVTDWSSYSDKNAIENIIKSYSYYPDDLEFKLDGTKKYLLVIKSFNIKNIDTKVFTSTGFTNDISLAVYLYRSVNMSKNQDMINFAKAIYAFHLSAKNY